MHIFNMLDFLIICYETMKVGISCMEFFYMSIISNQYPEGIFIPLNSEAD